MDHKSSTDQKKSLPLDSEGKVAPWSFPVPSTDPDTIETPATDIRTSDQSISGTGNDIKTSRAGLSTCYESPENDHILYSAFNPVDRDGEAVHTGLNRMAGALEDFAATTYFIEHRWEILTEDAYTFRARIDQEGEAWDDGGGAFGVSENPDVAENQALYERGVPLTGDHEDAERDCAEAIDFGLVDRTRFEAMPADAQAEDLDENRTNLRSTYTKP